MAQEKPANQDLSQAISSPFISADMETLYEQYMDMMLAQIGRNVTFYMQPGLAETTSNPDQYNPWIGQQDPRLGNSGDGSKGATVSPITVVYRAQIVHGPKANTPHMPWDLKVEEVMISLPIGALQDVKLAVEAEVDGIKYSKKPSDIRQFGLTTPKYIMTFWSKKVAD